MKRFTTAAAAAIAIAVALTACSGAGNKGSGGNESLTFAVVTPPTSFTPGAMPAGGPEATYFEPVYDTLLALDKDGQPVANLVTDWSYDEALTTLTVTLRDDVDFTDGQHFDAEALKANLEATKAGTGASGQALRFVNDVTVVDDTHADINLTAPDPSLLANLARSSGYVASPAALGTDTLATAPVGSGPYVLDADKSTPGDSYVYSRNPDYWNKDAYPYNAVTVRFVDDTTAILNGLRTGEINAVLGSSTEIVDGAKQADLSVSNYVNGAVEGMFIWDRAGKLVPALGDVRVRQAMNYAIDRETIIDKVKGGAGEVTMQPFSPQDPAHLASLEDAYPYDVAKAKQLMSEAGYADGFTMSLPDFSPIYPDEQAAMTEMLAAINIKLEFTPVTGDQVIGNLIQGQYPMNFFSLSATDAWNFSQLAIAQGGTFNPFHAEDATVASLLAKAQSSTGDEQAAALQEINSYVTEQAWFGLWYFQEGSIVTTNDVAVTVVPGTNVPPLANFSPKS
ncbi:peptide ABC transporter substrate-binding protein [Agreia pratensis]|uniref:ABC transporter substrate-binding protein n=1 Tax=Agreia pratensis TaxID=150121 RepID=UPI00188CD7D9|nr:ABC transporter substrate-binding protein [Agreia pratensis]MBF4635301.1 peptide ABC transporter substrate-binding protein [Agreia pratensis]